MVRRLLNRCARLGQQSGRLLPSSGKPGEVEANEVARGARAQASTTARRTWCGDVIYPIQIEHIRCHVEGTHGDESDVSKPSVHQMEILFKPPDRRHDQDNSRHAGNSTVSFVE